MATHETHNRLLCTTIQDSFGPPRGKYYNAHACFQRSLKRRPDLRLDARGGLIKYRLFFPRYVSVYNFTRFTRYIYEPHGFEGSLSSCYADRAMEAEVLFDFEKQEDNELNLIVGEIVTNVTQVCVGRALGYG